MSRFSSIFASLSLFLVPVTVFAAPTTFKGLVNIFVNIINTAVVPLVFALSFIVFIWGIFLYFLFPDSPDQISKGKNLIIWGLIVFAIMVSVWGLVNAVAYSFFPDLTCLNRGGCFGPF